ncbi:hypothetical protein FB45DRAFT_1038006 [Roridomyces roridus]|uniref:MYND-type domain-containing protein n=1 Tax=Roridomyces roridus TaxID=1738132 RepID=A0AAD7B5D5_9AGAR|nr:hypothetical protein FB45DRAFT_1038006 [Roridomyces roridus]
MLLLPAGPVYFHAVAAYRHALKDVQDLLLGDNFKQTVLYDPWQTFGTSAAEHLEALAQSPLFMGAKACDNQDCGLIDGADSLKRCSGCQVFYYCSVECQRNDWELRHRKACSTHDSLLLSKRAGLIYKERLFLRTLIHHKYIKERPSIYAQQIQVLSEYDPAVPRRPLHALRLLPVITVYPIDPEDEEAQERLHDLVDTESDEWEDLVRRAMTR